MTHVTQKTTVGRSENLKSLFVGLEVQETIKSMYGFLPSTLANRFAQMFEAGILPFVKLKKHNKLARQNNEKHHITIEELQISQIIDILICTCPSPVLQTKVI